ncbi:MAG: alpha-glucuronidase [Bacteroidales bacterium]|nr:alpha-glucuronidase [Bacteroidales bacterium]MBN2817529.1 alpha-glucuronidase [Bacteroidales bacterium]
MKIAKLIFITGLILFIPFQMKAEDGYKLWLRYSKISDKVLAEKYSGILKSICLTKEISNSDVIKSEIELAAHDMLAHAPEITSEITENTSLIIGIKGKCDLLKTKNMEQILSTLGDEGYYIDQISDKKTNYFVIAANTPAGALYGTFHLTRLMQSCSDFTELPVSESPKIKHRILNHWDNLDRTVERGYAGFSIWDWHRLPNHIYPRYIDYARANASVGINGTVLTNVNANAFVLTPQYIEKVKALADVFRPYGLKVYLTARFSSPIEIGGLKTADPTVAEVKQWWKDKVDEIYESIPDFGGFLVKANSEGQPGPQNYDRSHAEGANMLAEALAPHGGIVMWRAFVYSHEAPDDRAKQANNEFVPLDGQFNDNVMIQVKNGAIDFQPREPFHPLFGSMPNSSLALELQITQEYLGQGTHLAYLAPLYKECLDSDTYKTGKGTTVAKIIDGTIYQNEHTAIAGVSNIGNDKNWTGHLFGQANWYAFGRLAWNHNLSSELIAEEWIRQTFGNTPRLVNSITEIMLPSREAVVNYMTPMGLHHIMGWDHHYGPGPWVNIGRPDWTSLYYHQADSSGIGFDRTATGSDALCQYAPEIEKEYSNLETCPEKFLLWFHHLPWGYTTKAGNTLWNELCYKYNTGVRSAESMHQTWLKLQSDIDAERFNQVADFLMIQENEAKWWRNACLLYFQQFSGMPFPEDIEQPEGELEYYQNLKFPYAPGIKPSW